MVSEELVRQVASKVLQRIEADLLAEAAKRAADLLPPAASTRQEAVPEIEKETAHFPTEFFAPWTGEVFKASGPAPIYPPQPRQPAAHPSQEQFEINEAAETFSAVSELVEFLEAQRCTIEKKKPCDHCGVCRTLGF